AVSHWLNLSSAGSFTRFNWVAFSPMRSYWAACLYTHAWATAIVISCRSSRVLPCLHALQCWLVQLGRDIPSGLMLRLRSTGVSRFWPLGGYDHLLAHAALVPLGLFVRVLAVRCVIGR